MNPDCPMSTMLMDKEIVLGVCGGIAAYKAPELLRLMMRAGARVRVIMTRNARAFVGPATFEALSGRKVCADLFDPHDPDASVKHIEWAQEARAVVIAPATANLVGKLACGIADDALTTFLLAVTCPVLICPSMNTHMYLSPPVQRNLATLRQDGRTVLKPGSGQLACGTTGPGRLPEPPVILDRLQAALSSKDLAGKHVIVTAGPTWERLDPVRFISNPASGKMGYALAQAAEYRGARVTLITGPTHLSPPVNVETVAVESAAEMADAVFARFKTAHIVIKAAAVGDYRPAALSPHKIKKSADVLNLELVKNPDILSALGREKGDVFLVGFAAETQDLRENATEKLTRKNLDMIVGNLVGGSDSGFSADTNRVTLFFRSGESESLDLMPKEAVAHRILDRITQRTA